MKVTSKIPTYRPKKYTEEMMRNDFDIYLEEMMIKNLFNEGKITDKQRDDIMYLFKKKMGVDVNAL